MSSAASQLTKRQVKKYGPRLIDGWGKGAQITAEVRYDDECNNGHNSFAITGEIRIPGRRDIEAGGTLHDEIVKAFPELAPFIKWHLMSSDAPLHYIANARYWAGFYGYKNGGPNDPPNMAYLKSTIVYGAVPSDSNFDLAKMDDNDLQSFLNNRLPDLLIAFRQAVESLGFVY